MRYALLILLFACGSKSNPPSPPEPTPPAANDCIKTGCSGTVCAEPGKDVMTTCEFKPEYACYRDAACERQGDGSCGWTQSPALTACLANPPAAEAGGTPQ
jgi:eight-cysteine-cluster-containing protein